MKCLSHQIWSDCHFHSVIYMLHQWCGMHTSYLLCSFPLIIDWCIISSILAITIYVAGKYGSHNVWQKWMDEKVWQMNRSAKRLLIVTTNLDGFSLANHWWFTKFTKLSPTKHSYHMIFGYLFIFTWITDFRCYT